MERDEHREERIVMRAIVDAYGAEEQAMGWYCYLEDEMTFPFEACCSTRRRTSALKVGERYEISGMADEEDCDAEMYVMARFGDDELAVPLSQLEPVEELDEETREAIMDWKYWTERGYSFG